MTKHTFDVEELIRLAQTELRNIERGKDFLLSDVHSISKKAYMKYPEDAVIRQFAFVMDKLSEKHGPSATIDQKEMSEIYNNFANISQGSKFREVMGSLIFAKPAQKTASVAENRAGDERAPIDVSTDLDKELTAGLTEIFGNKIIADHMANSNAAKRGAELVSTELQSLGFKNQKIKFAGSDENALVYTSNFDTVNGPVAVSVPIEMSSGKINLPSVFVADSKFEALTAENLNKFIQKKSANYNFTSPPTSSILEAIAILTGKVKVAGNDFDNMLGKLGGGEYVKEKQHDLDCNVNLSTMTALADDRKDVFDPNTIEENYAVSWSSNMPVGASPDMPKELEHLAHDFEDNILESASSFGQNAVQAGKNIISAELSSAGFKNAQVKFASESEDSAIYVAGINTPKGKMDIEVPLEMKHIGGARYEPLLPSCFACDGVIEDFTPAKLQRFVLHHTPSTAQVVYSSVYSYMTLPELRDEIIKSASSNDYVECEMILGTIQDKFGEEDYKNAVSDYHFALTLKNKEAGMVKKCSQEIPAGKGSIYPRCGHFHVTMDKVLVGSDGKCVLKSSLLRDEQSPVSETGASISTSKIILT